MSVHERSPQDVHQIDHDGLKHFSHQLCHHDLGSRLIMQSDAHPDHRSIAASAGSGCVVMSVLDKTESHSKEEDETDSHSKEEELTQIQEQQAKSKQDTTKRKQVGSDDKGSTNLSVVETSTLKTDHEGNQKVVRFACGGKKIVTGGEDRQVNVWRVSSERWS